MSLRKTRVAHVQHMMSHVCATRVAPRPVSLPVISIRVARTERPQNRPMSRERRRPRSAAEAGAASTTTAPSRKTARCRRACTRERRRSTMAAERSTSVAARSGSHVRCAPHSRSRRGDQLAPDRSRRARRRQTRLLGAHLQSHGTCASMCSMNAHSHQMLHSLEQGPAPARGQRLTRTAKSGRKRETHVGTIAAAKKGNTNVNPAAGEASAKHQTNQSRATSAG